MTSALWKCRNGLTSTKVIPRTVGMLFPEIVCGRSRVEGTWRAIDQGHRCGTDGWEET